MTKRAFGNALRILYSTEVDDLVAASIIAGTDQKQQKLFANDPMQWFIRADDQQTDAIWGMIQARQPQELVG